MRKWGNRSFDAYETLNPELKDIMDYVLREVADVSLLQGHRDKVTQNFYFATGKSQLQWPDSEHNSWPSDAVDFQPYPMPAEKHKQWAALAYIAGRAIAYAESLGLTLRWGGDWNQNGDLTDQRFDDLFHLELIGMQQRADT